MKFGSNENLVIDNRVLSICDSDFSNNSSMDFWEKFGVVKKDVKEGDIFKVSTLSSANNNRFLLSCLGGVNLSCNLKKEKKFFEMYGEVFESLDSFVEWLNSESSSFFATNDVSVQCVEIKDGLGIGSLVEAHLDTKKCEFFEEIKNPQKVYSAVVKDKNLGGFLVSINGINAFLPGSLAAANKITNFDSLIGKTINVMLEDYLKDGDTFIVSNKKYIQYVLPQMLKLLKNDVQYTGTITGTSKFGIFIEFQDILTGLLHFSEMSEDTKEKFNNGYFRQGMSIKFFVKEVLKDNKIILSENEYVDESISLEDFKTSNEGTVMTGVVVSTKPYGFFINFGINTTQFIGLLHIKELNGKRFRKGDDVTCLISSVDLEQKKIFLKYIQN